MGQNEAEMKSDEKGGDTEDEIEQKEQTCENSMKQKVVDRKCEEEYITWQMKQYGLTRTNQKVQRLKTPIGPWIQMKFTAMTAGTQMISRTS